MVIEKINELETKFSFQEDQLEELGKEMLRQQRQISELLRELALLKLQMSELIEREVKRGMATDQHEIPPHY